MRWHTFRVGTRLPPQIVPSPLIDIPHSSSDRIAIALRIHHVIYVVGAEVAPNVSSNLTIEMEHFKLIVLKTTPSNGVVNKHTDTPRRKTL
jgi:hypothetical protein